MHTTKRLICQKGQNLIKASSNVSMVGLRSAKISAMAQPMGPTASVNFRQFAYLGAVPQRGFFSKKEEAKAEPEQKKEQEEKAEETTSTEDEGKKQEKKEEESESSSSDEVELSAEDYQKIRDLISEQDKKIEDLEKKITAYEKDIKEYK